MNRRPLLQPLLAAVALAGCGSCRSRPEPGGDASAGAAVTTFPAPRASASAEPSALPRPGMAWIPPGSLRAGTPPDKTPRVPDEEMAGDAVTMTGYYIDLLPYPNEPGAIPTSNVSRDEAAQLCVARGKRLCTELEWERACKGADNTSYEYGDVYRGQPCETGASAEEAARRPTGEHALCKSTFGVADMHGGVWEWTSSPWGRGAKDASLGVLRGGNAAAGEIVGRCANALGRATAKKSPTMGFRCCAGAKNSAEVHLALKGAPGVVQHHGEDFREVWGEALEQKIGEDAALFRRAWTWIPVPNEELTIIAGCDKNAAPTCTIVVGRIENGKPRVLATAPAGMKEPLADVLRLGDARHLRLRGIDPRGTFGRDITWAYGRVEIADEQRP